MKDEKIYGGKDFLEYLDNKDCLENSNSLKLIWGLRWG